MVLRDFMEAKVDIHFFSNLGAQGALDKLEVTKMEGRASPYKNLKAKTWSVHSHPSKLHTLPTFTLKVLVHNLQIVFCRRFMSCGQQGRFAVSVD